jgi:hypothetical protein
LWVSQLRICLGQRAGLAEEITLGKINANGPELGQRSLLLDKFCDTLNPETMGDIID